ncbi:MAG: ATP-binding cassette domain-containing protein [Bacteroidales bacterium]|nr:ATP-binding cassette domain-containing protein [Bacteroidales bacterium]
MRRNLRKKVQSIIKIGNPVNLCLQDGQQIAIVGDNAAGKTALVNILMGRSRLPGNPVSYDFSPSASNMVSDNIRYIEFQDAYGAAGANYYHQLRWNSVEIDEETPTAGELLQGVGDEALREELFTLFNLRPVLDKYIITLSSGELRKFHIARALLSKPRVLILDNPFIGLDAQTRDQLSDLLGRLAASWKLMIILVMSRWEVMPTFINRIIPVDDVKQPDAISRQDEIRESILSLPDKEFPKGGFYPSEEGSCILKFNNITIRYDTRTILKDFSWTVHEGERWAITGQNGAGKSTLLSLVCADNPQAYACDMEIFGHKRGTGESIWDIKKHIGYVSPEMHRSYQKNITALEVVASGLFDTVGLYMHPDSDQLERSRWWMKIFQIEDLASRSYLRLSSGEQRLCLLARAFVKDPELLILDEPMHGLDYKNMYIVQKIIYIFASRSRKTLLMVSHYASEFPPCINHKLELVRF